MTNVVAIDRARPPAVDGMASPHDLGAEAAVISAVLIDESKLDACGMLRPEHFYAEAHRQVYSAILSVVATNQAVDITTVASRLRETNRLPQVGGMGYLTELLNGSPAIANVGDHARIVYERWRARAAAALGQRIVAQAYHDHGDTQGLLDLATREFGDLARQAPGKREETNLEMLRRLVNDIRERAAFQAANPGVDTKKFGIPWGIYGLDQRTLGLHATKKVTIVAPNGVGKTSMALQLCIGAAKQGIGSLFFSCEMTREELLLKQLAHCSRVDSFRLVAGRLSTEEWSRIMAAVDVVGGMPIHIVEDGYLHTDKIDAIVRSVIRAAEAERREPIGLIVVDYIQKLAPAPRHVRMDRHEYLGHASYELKEIAKRTKLPVVELAQRKSASDAKAGERVLPRPREDEFADCRSIPKSSDQVLFLWQPPVTNPGTGKATTTPNRRKVVVMCTKNRGGASDWEVELDVIPEWGMYVDPNDPMRPVRDHVDQAFAEDGAGRSGNPLTDGL